jgi:hypothetical protein
MLRCFVRRISLTRAHTARTLTIYGLGLLLLAGAFCLAFELGRYQAGFSLLDHRRERGSLQQRLGERERALTELERQVALLQTSREIDRETYARVEANLGQLQARIQSQEEELAFYRGIVSPQDGLAGLRVQELELIPTDTEGAFLLRLVLVQAIINSEAVSGTVQVRIIGTQDGQEASWKLDDLSRGAAEELAYRFRYFQGFERELMLPTGFVPTQVEIEIRPAGSSDEPLERSFEWAAVLG